MSRTGMRSIMVSRGIRAFQYNGSLQESGRKYCNVPKERGRFTFIRDPQAKPGTMPYSKVTVAPWDRPDDPCFVIEMSSTWFSRPILPFNTKLLGNAMYMVQPPLPESPNWRNDGMVGTRDWRGFKPVVKGKAGVFRVKGGLPGDRCGDDVGYPPVSPCSFGLWIPLATVECEVGTDIEDY